MHQTILDEELLSGYLTTLGKDIVRQMMDLYKQQSRIYLQDVSQAVFNDSNELWQEHCHKMKGAAGSVGLKVLHGYIVTIEKSEASSEEKKALLEKLTELNDSAIAAFNTWLNAA